MVSGGGFLPKRALLRLGFVVRACLSLALSLSGCRCQILSTCHDPFSLATATSNAGWHEGNERNCITTFLVVDTENCEKNLCLGGTEGGVLLLKQVLEAG